MPYVVAIPVNRIGEILEEPGVSDSGNRSYFGHKGTINLASGRAAHLEYSEKGPKLPASIFKPSPDDAGTDAPESSTRASNGIRPLNMIVLDAPRSFLQKVFDWLFGLHPFSDDALPLSDRQARTFNQLEHQILGPYGQHAAGSNSETAQAYGDAVGRINTLAAAKQAIKDVRAAAHKGPRASWAQVRENLQNPLVADMVWADPELPGKLANLCRDSDSLLEFALSFDAAGENATPGLERLIGLGGDMERIFERALLNSCKDLSCADTIARLKPFMKAPIGPRLFGTQPSSGHCKDLRKLLFSKVSTPDEALQMAELFPWDTGVAMNRIQINPGVQTRMRAHIDSAFTNALPPDFATVEGEAFETFKRYIEAELPSLFDPSPAAGRPVLPAWHLFELRTIVMLGKAEERYHDEIDFAKLLAFFPEFWPAQSPPPATH